MVCGGLQQVVIEVPETRARMLDHCLPSHSEDFDWFSGLIDQVAELVGLIPPAKPAAENHTT